MLERSICLTVGLSALLGLVPGPAGACAVRLGTPLATPLNYDPFALSSVRSQIQTSVEQIDHGDCTATLRVTDASLAPLEHVAVGNASKAVFDVRSATDGSVTGNQITLHFTSSTPRQLARWDLVVTRDAVLSPGTYPVPFAVTARTDSAATDIVERGQWLLSVPSRAQVNIAGASGGFGASHVSVVDFGTLTTGAHRRVFVQVRANTPVTAEISSKNGGVLRNDSWPQAEPIAYAVALDQQALDLGGPQHMAVDPPLTIDGTSLPLDMTIGEVTGKMAGRYSDVITIDVSPR